MKEKKRRKRRVKGEGLGRKKDKWWSGQGKDLYNYTIWGSNSLEGHKAILHSCSLLSHFHFLNMQVCMQYYSFLHVLELAKLSSNHINWNL